MTGKTFCVSHDPERMAKQAADLARMRERSLDPAKFEPTKPLREEILAAAEYVGWPALKDAMATLGRTEKGYLQGIVSGKRAGDRIGKARAREIRMALSIATQPQEEVA
jgi:hypothetical protein